MRKILVAYSTDSGSTAQVAEAIAGALSEPVEGGRSGMAPGNLASTGSASHASPPEPVEGEPVEGEPVEGEPVEGEPVEGGRSSLGPGTLASTSSASSASPPEPVEGPSNRLGEAIKSSADSASFAQYPFGAVVQTDWLRQAQPAPLPPELAEGELAEGVTVDLRQLEEVSSVEGYSAVVIGAPMILGWHRPAIRFVKQHQAALSRVPVAYFFTAMSLTQLSEQVVNGVPVAVDPRLARPPKNPARLGLKERYARVSNYLTPALKAAPSVRPMSVAFFGGKLELFRLKLLPMLFVMIVIQAQPGDLRNWTFIRAWAAGLRQAFR